MIDNDLDCSGNLFGSCKTDVVFPRVHKACITARNGKRNRLEYIVKWHVDKIDRNWNNNIFV